MTGPTLNLRRRGTMMTSDLEELGMTSADGRSRRRGRPNGKDRSAIALIPVPQMLTVSDWLLADIPEPDRLMGDLFTTSSRMTLAAASGLGKTNFCLALAFAMAEGRDFLRWRAWRDGPSKVLYVDGEMPKRLMKRRVADAARRADFLSRRPRHL